MEMGVGWEGDVAEGKMWKDIFLSIPLTHVLPVILR